MAVAKLKTITCPNCGTVLKYEKLGETVICVSCESPVVAVEENNVSPQESRQAKIDKIETSSTALAYIEQFLDDYDWDSFVFDDDFSIDELDKLVDSLKITAADDARTWIAAFVCLVVPFERKVEYRKKALKTLINEFKNNNLDSYGMYEAYKKAARAIVYNFDNVKEKAKKILAYAKKYGADEHILSQYEKQLNDLDISEVEDSIFDSIEEIPEIVKHREKEQEKIIEELAEQGIDAKHDYEKALEYRETRDFKKAIELFVKIRRFKDSEKQISGMENSFEISNVIYVKGNYYYVEKQAETSGFSLYQIKDAKPVETPILKNIKKVVKLYANSIYYLTNYDLRVYDFDTKQNTVLCKEKVTSFEFDIYNQAIYVLCEKHIDYKIEYNLKKISLIDNNIVVCDEKISKVNKFMNGFCSYIKANKNIIKSYVYDLNKQKSYCLGSGAIEVCGCVDNSAIYLKRNPDDYNKNLYIVELKDVVAPVLLEANITGDCQVLNEKIYYYTIDNLDCKILISANTDGSERRELSKYVDKILFVSGKWIYFKRTYGYNTALCKVRNNGSKVDIIATQIDEFIKIEAGYLYYISDNRKLHKVRMDGTRDRVLCESVEKVLVIRDNKIVFSALDKLLSSTTALDGLVKKTYSKSIYAIDFDGQGRRKAAYDVGEVINNSEEIFFTKTTKIKEGENYKAQKYLYRLDIDTYSVEKITSLVAEQKQGGCYVATCVYGSYDCPQVWTLRRYRDDTLGATWYGRAFIKLYYAISPTLVKWFGKTKWFKKMWKGKLDRMVKKLQDNGVESSPYNDKEW